MDDALNKFYNDEQIIHQKHYTIWELIKTFWQSKHKFTAYLFIIVIFIMTITIVGVNLIFNFWYNNFYNALQAYDKHKTLTLLGYFCLIALAAIILAVYRYYITQLLALRWRRWLTEQFLGYWLHKRGYYYLENFDKQTDNPDQRIQEDVGALITNSLDLATGLISSITTFFAFIFVLWKLSGDFHLDLFGRTWHIPGYLMWVSIIYCLIGTLLTFKIGRPLIMLNFEQQRREASFRYAAVDLRTHSENVALYRGEHHQRSILDNLLEKVLGNWYQIILRQKKLIWFTSGFNQIAVLLPLAVALPNYFEKVFLLGGLMQTLQAFGQVQDSLAYLVNSYSQIALWQAIGRRLTTFLNHLADVEDSAERADHLAFQRHVDNSIVANQVSIQTPEEKNLLLNIDQKFTHGQHYVIKGPSGIGKSTFVRTIAGIWPYASGKVLMPEKKHIMYLPQKNYMPIGTLAEAILFPDKKDPALVNRLEEVLRACNLAHLIPRLDETAAWSEQLSPGEQQRIAFARVLLHKPDWVFLDESTSMLDINNERKMYELIKEKLPHCSIVSVGHRPSLDEYHDQVVDMSDYSPEPA